MDRHGLKRRYENTELSDGRENHGPNGPDDVKGLKSMAEQKMLTPKQRSQLQWLVSDLEIWEEDVKRYGWENLSADEREKITLKRKLFKLLNETDKYRSKQKKKAIINWIHKEIIFLKDPHRRLSFESITTG